MKSQLTKKEYIADLVYLPFHLFLVPLGFGLLMRAGFLSEALANFLVYAVALVFMLIFLGKFLRRDFDPLCDRPLRCLLTVAGAYIGMMFFNSIVVVLLSLIEGGLGMVENQTNDSISELIQNYGGITVAMTVFMAPITEELLFRAGIFGLVRRKSRVAAYIISIAAFSACHVMGYVLTDPAYIIYIIEYIPASFFLCLCYERTDTIWAPIFLHMLVNGISVAAMGLIS